MRILVGTSGYSYKQWRGSFYPPKLPNEEMLGFYAARFPTVEINNTFYRMPNATVLEGWAAQVPEAFTFILKAPQRITHHTRLGDLDAVSYFLKTAAALGPRLGPILFQLPPRFPADIGRLRRLLAEVPADRQGAFEFRDPSWFVEDVYAALREHGAALCVADTDEDGATPLLPTASWGYLRLRKAEYTPEELGRWRVLIQEQPWTEAFVFFKHEDEARGPLFARQFMGSEGPPDAA